MKVERYTQKLQEAVESARELALEYGQQELMPEHVHLALLQDEQGTVVRILKNMNVDTASLQADLGAELNKMPKVSGNADNVYLGRRSDQLFTKAENLAFKKFKDEYVSTEHVYLILLEETGTPSAQVLRSHGVTKDAFLKELMKVRGNQRITSNTPEDSYDALVVPMAAPRTLMAPTPVRVQVMMIFSPMPINRLITGICCFPRPWSMAVAMLTRERKKKLSA